MISIIIPVFNSQKYLKECIDSCLNQTCGNLEIICINAGDKDNSLEILKDYSIKDSRVRVFNEPNLGIGDSRNLGVGESKGNYLLFLDSDDFLEPNALEILHKQMVEDNSDVIFFNTYHYFEETKLKNKFCTISPYEIRFSSCFLVEEAYDIIYKTFASPYKMYKKATWIENNVEFSDHAFAEDALPYFKFLAYSDKISICKECLYNYRKHPTSSTVSFATKSDCLFDIFYKCEKEIANSKHKDKLILPYLENRIRSFIYWLFCIDKKHRKKFFYRTKGIFSYVEKNYGAQLDELFEKSSTFYKILNMSYYQYVLFKMTRTFYAVIKSHYL